MCPLCGWQVLSVTKEEPNTYCLKDDCQARRRGVSGELARKDTGLGLDYGSVRAGSTGTGKAHREQQVQRPPRRPWTPQQERLVRLYHDMGLNPRAIAERARANNPRLGITERLVVQILSAPPPRR